MPDFTQGQRELLRLWGTIQQAYRDPELRAKPGGVTQYVWEALKQGYAASGLGPPSATIRDMNALMSAAGQQWRAEQGLKQAIDLYSRSGLDQAITAQHIAPDIDSRTLSQQPMGPSYRVRFKATYNVEGIPTVQHFTWSPGLSVPATVGDLLSHIHEAAAGFGEDYGIGEPTDVSVVGITSV